MAYKNKFDKTGSCSEDGASAEELFAKILDNLGGETIKSSLSEQFNHVDIDSLSIGKVDVKARKKTSRSQKRAQDDYIWVEFKNVRGNKGWLYGKADWIAFERDKDFVVVCRKELAKLCENLVDLNKSAKTSASSLYKSYQREGRKDVISLIKSSDLLTIKHLILNKDKNMLKKGTKYSLPSLEILYIHKDIDGVEKLPLNFEANSVVVWEDGKTTIKSSTSDLIIQINMDGSQYAASDKSKVILEGFADCYITDLKEAKVYTFLSRSIIKVTF